MKVPIKILKCLDFGKEDCCQKVLPRYSTEQSAGMDLIAANDEDISILPGQRSLIPTGIAIALPSGFVAQVCSRSGLAAKHGVCVLNAPGTIDPDYRGEIQVILINFGTDIFVVKGGMRIAQLIISQYKTIEWEVVRELDQTARGDGGFGSTGV
jgi:dUTP pyrophosphatase